MSLHTTAATLTAWLATAGVAGAINIVVDYRYDTAGFFPAGSQRRATMEAAAQRYSDIITDSLSVATLLDNAFDPRIGFTHPGTGQSWEVSAAVSSSSDRLTDLGASAADEYRGPWSIAADEWILYAGARPLSAAGLGGTGTGNNITTLFEQASSHLNRGFRSSNEFGNLPVWGGVVSFDTGTNWHFDLATAPPTGQVDFYSIAMHEIGHALGLSADWLDWTQDVAGNSYRGSNAVAAYNADNGASLSGLSLVDATNNPPNHHFADQTYDSRIFAAGDPQLAGTVGLFGLQDLLMEPVANFSPSVRRLELTNVDAAALEDVGWSLIASTAPTLPGDYDFDGDVDAADYTIWRGNLGTPNAVGTYSEWSANYGLTEPPAAASVPEPAALVLAAAGALAARRRRR